MNSMDLLLEIKKSLNISSVLIAEVLNTSTTTIGKIINGKAVLNETQLRILTLIKELSLTRDLSRLKVAWHIPLDGMSFMHLLHDPSVDLLTLDLKFQSLISRMAPTKVFTTKNKRHRELDIYKHYGSFSLCKYR